MKMTTPTPTAPLTLEQQQALLAKVLNQASDLVVAMANTAINSVSFKDLAAMDRLEADFIERRENARERSFQQLGYILRDIRVASSNLVDSHSFPSTSGSFHHICQAENALSEYTNFSLAAQAIAHSNSKATA